MYSEKERKLKRREIEKRYRANNKERMSKICHKHYLKYRERLIEESRLYRASNKEKIAMADKKRKKVLQDLLSPSYIRQVLTRRNRSLTYQDIPDSMVQTYKQYLLLKREVRNVKRQQSANAV